MMTDDEISRRVSMAVEAVMRSRDYKAPCENNTDMERTAQGEKKKERRTWLRLVHSVD